MCPLAMKVVATPAIAFASILPTVYLLLPSVLVEELALEPPPLPLVAASLRRWRSRSTAGAPALASVWVAAASTAPSTPASTAAATPAAAASAESSRTKGVTTPAAFTAARAFVVVVVVIFD